MIVCGIAESVAVAVFLHIGVDVCLIMAEQDGCRVLVAGRIMIPVPG